MSQVSYNTFLRGNIAELMAEFGRFDQEQPTVVANPKISIERWNGTQLISIVNNAPMDPMSGHLTKHIYEWNIPIDAVLDSYLISYDAVVDDMPANFSETIEVIEDPDE